VRPAGLALALPGAILALRSALLLTGRGRPRRGPKPAFVLAGPYLRVRNPLYAGLVLALGGRARRALDRARARDARTRRRPPPLGGARREPRLRARSGGVRRVLPARAALAAAATPRRLAGHRIRGTATSFLTPPPSQGLTVHRSPSNHVNHHHDRHHHHVQAIDLQPNSSGTGASSRFRAAGSAPLRGPTRRFEIAPQVAGSFGGARCCARRGMRAVRGARVTTVTDAWQPRDRRVHGCTCRRGEPSTRAFNEARGGPRRRSGRAPRRRGS
jgi:hypothetical protein